MFILNVILEQLVQWRHFICSRNSFSHISVLPVLLFINPDGFSVSGWAVAIRGCRDVSLLWSIIEKDGKGSKHISAQKEATPLKGLNVTNFLQLKCINHILFAVCERIVTWREKWVPTWRTLVIAAEHSHVTCFMFWSLIQWRQTCPWPISPRLQISQRNTQDGWTALQERWNTCILGLWGELSLLSCPLNPGGLYVSLTAINRHKTTPIWRDVWAEFQQLNGPFWWRCFVNSCKDCVIQCDLLWLTRAGIIMVCACVGCHAALLSSFSHL